MREPSSPRPESPAEVRQRIDRKNRPQGLQDRGLMGTLGVSDPKRTLIFLLCMLASLAGMWFLPGASELESPASRALFILLFAGSLWVTEAIPAFAVGILVIGLEVALLGSEQGGATSTKDWQQFAAVLGSPLVWLFFGGFVLAAGLEKTGLDRWLASRLLQRFGTRPSMVLLGVMSGTFVLSMFISNTATAAMMIAMASPIAASDTKGKFGTAVVLGIAFAANVGGIGSLIGTPPNAIAVGALADTLQYEITFLQWMLLGLPFGMVLLVFGWLYICRFYPAGVDRIEIAWDAPEGSDASPKPSAPLWQLIVVVGVLLATVGLWLTSQYHGIPTAAVSFLPIVGFTASGVLTSRQIRGLNYDVLFLLAGGLALGTAVLSTGLSDWIVGLLAVEGLSQTQLAMLWSLFAIVLSNLMSNTAAANVLVPIAILTSLSHAIEIAVPVAMACSAAMALPVATPPNALAHATGKVHSRDFLRLGILTAIFVVPAAAWWIDFALPIVGRMS